MVTYANKLVRISLKATRKIQTMQDELNLSLIRNSRARRIKKFSFIQASFLCSDLIELGSKTREGQRLMREFKK